MRRHLNYKFIALVLVGTAVAGVCVHFLHAFQVVRNAAGLRTQGEKAEAEKRYQDAAGYYRRYLGLVKDDTDTLEKYGLVLHELYEQARDNLSGQTRARGTAAFFVLEQVLRRDPERKHLRRAQADLAVVLGDHSAARAHLLALEPEGNAELERQLGLCELALGHLAGTDTTSTVTGAGKGRGAVDWFEEATKHAPQELDNYESIAFIYRRKFDPPRSVPADEVMAKMVKVNDTAKAWLAMLNYRLESDRLRSDYIAKAEKALQKAEEALERADSKNSTDIDVIFARVKFERLLVDQLKGKRQKDKREEHLTRARNLLQKALTKYPENARIYLQLIELERQDKNAELAEKHLAAALAKPALKENWDLLSLAVDGHIQRGELKKAETIVKENLKDAKPSSFPETPTKAQKLAEQAREKQSRDIIVAYHEARIEMLRAEKATTGADGSGSWAKARDLLEKLGTAAEGHPLTPSILLLLGTCNERLGNPDQALVAYEKVIKSDPVSLEARARLGAVWAVLGKEEKAAAEYQQLLSFEGAPPAARIGLARFLIIRNFRLPEKSQNWKEVRDVLAPIEALEKPILIAESYAAEKNIAEARKVLKAALDGKREQAIYWAALARLEGNQRLEDGLQVLNKAKKELKIVDGAQLALARISLVARKPQKEALAELQQIEKSLTPENDTDRTNLAWGLANGYFQARAVGTAYRVIEGLARKRPGDLALRLVLFDLAGDDKASENALKSMSDDDKALDQKKTPENQQALADAIKDLEGPRGVYWRQAQAILLVKQAQTLEGSEQKTKLLVQAREYLDEVSRRRPLWFRVPALEAEVNLLEKLEERALEAYERAMALGDRRPRTIRARYGLLIARGRYHEAVRALTQLIDDKQTLKATGLGKVATDYLLSDVATDRLLPRDQALNLARESVDSASKDYRDHLWLGQVLWKIGKGENGAKADKHLAEAESEFRRARTDAPDAPETWVALIAFLADTKRVSDARTLLDQAKQQLKGDKANLAFAEGHEALGELEKAENYFDKALKAKTTPDIRRNVAAFYLRSKQKKKAEDHLRELANNKSPTAMDHVLWARRNLALILGTNGEYPKFREALGLLQANLDMLDDNKKDSARTDDKNNGENNQDNTDKDKRDPTRVRNQLRTDRRIKAILLATQPGHRREALALFEEANRDERLSGTDLFILARLYGFEDGQNWRKAELCLLRLLGEAEKNPAYLAYYVRGLIKNNKAVAGVWLSRLEKTASGPAVLELRARLHRARGEDSKAIDLVRGRTDEKIFVPMMSLLADLAKEAPSDEDYLKCAAALHDRLAKAPGSSLAYADFLVKRKKVAQALPILDQLAAKKPEEMALKTSLVLLSAANADPVAYDHVERWLHKAGTSNSVVLCQGHLRVRQGNYREAAVLYEKALEKERDLRQIGLVLNNLAWLAALDNDHAKALKLIDRALAVAGPSPGLLDTQGLAELMAGDPKAAAAKFRQAIEIRDSPAYWFHVALAESRINDLAAAAVAFEKGAAADAVHPVERAMYQQLQELLRSRPAPGKSSK